MPTMVLPDRTLETDAAPRTRHSDGGCARQRPARPAGQQKRNFVTSFVDPLIAFVSAHAWLAYLTIFLAALLEAVPVGGWVSPGSPIFLTLSALGRAGELDLVAVFPPPAPAQPSATEWRSGSDTAHNARSSARGQ